MRAPTQPVPVSLRVHDEVAIARAALAAALVHFCQRTGSRLIAEGVETASELQTVNVLGVHAAQGYVFGPPTLLADAITPAPDGLEPILGRLD